jgi:methionyl-tRNA synthetase
MISIDDFSKVEIRAGKILDAVEILESEKLLKLSVDFGEERPRTVVSGVKKYFPDPSELVGVVCGFVTNLEPRPLMGIESEAMILAVTSGEKISLLRIDSDVLPGMRVK